MKDDIQLRWQWPAGQTADGRVALRVASIEAKSGGLFGIQLSPSLAENFPEPTWLRGSALAGVAGWQGKRVALLAPKGELPKVAAGDRVALELSGKICICIAQVPHDVADGELQGWLASWHCAKN